MDDQRNAPDDLRSRIEALRRRLEEQVDWRRRAERPEPAAEPIPTLHPEGAADLSTNKWRTAGWAVIGVFLIGGVAWASVARLDGAAIALGTVGVESNRKSVAHLEGGILRDILVHEGQRVRAGDVLVRMDGTRAAATLDLLRNRMDANRVRLARLAAERQSLTSVEFPSTLLDRADDPKVVDLMEGEMQVFDTRRGNLARQDAILKERISKQRAEIRGLTAKRTAAQKRQTLLGEERQMMHGLVRDGLIARNRLLAVERSAAEAEGDVHDLTAKIAQAEDEIAKLEMERTLAHDTHQKEVAASFQETREQIAETTEKIRAAADISKRTDVQAPVDGVVVLLRHHTTGGVVQAGEPILEMIPDNERYVVELRIDPDDIDVVYPGQPARVRLTAFSARTTPMIEGKVVQVSADRIVDPKTGAGFFAGRVMPDAAQTPDGNMPDLQPGMMAEVFLVTGERTVLDYLLDPLTRTLGRAGREL